MRRNPWLIFVVCTTVLMVLLAACGETAAPAPTTAPAKPAGQSTAAPAAGQKSATLVPIQPGPKMPAAVKIGFLSSLTSAISDSSTANKRGFELAIEDFNGAGGFGGTPVQGVAYDDEFKPEKSVELTTRLISVDKVAGLLGYNATGSALPAIDVAQKNKVPLIGTGAGTLEIVGRYAKESQNFMFGVRMIESLQMQTAIQFLRDKRGIALDSIAVIHDPSGYGVEATADLTKVLAAAGGKLRAEEVIEADAKDATPQLQRLQQSGAKAVIIIMYAPTTTVVLQSAKKINFQPLFAMDWGGSQQVLYKLAGPELLKGVVFVQSFTVDMSPEAKAMAQRLQQKYGELLFPLNTAQGYDGTLMLLQAIGNAGTTEGPKVVEALENIKGFKGITKVAATPFSRADHEALNQASMYFMGEWKEGVVVAVQ